CGRDAAADWLGTGFAGTHPRSSNVFGHEFRREGLSWTGKYGFDYSVFFPRKVT
ncbi:hypothetical protein GOODEAATRI_008616, partial [Goodea atripinnis]